MITQNPSSAAAGIPVRDRILEDLFRATVTLCRAGSSVTRHDPVVEQVIIDLDRAMRLLRDSSRLDVPADED